MVNEDSAIDALFNTSFHISRVSPFNLRQTGTEFISPSILKFHAKRLGDIVRGNILRGVNVSSFTEDSTSSRTGTLQNVEFIDLASANSSNGPNVQVKGITGIAIRFTYSKSSYHAFLLKPTTTIEPPAGSRRRSSRLRMSLDGVEEQNPNHYPLLLYRLPASLSAVFIQYLAENFDCTVSPLKLTADYTIRAVEKHLELYMPQPGRPPSFPTKDLTLTLEPPPIEQPKSSTTNGSSDDATAKSRGIKANDQVQDTSTTQTKLQTLRTMTITIRKEDLPGFLYHGTRIKLQRQDDDDKHGVFELALNKYMYETSGIYTEKLRLQKATCGDFAIDQGIDSQARCKMFMPAKSGRGGDGGVEEEESGVVKVVFLSDLLAEAVGTFV